MTDPQTLRALAAELCEMTQPSYEMDCRIMDAVGVCPDNVPEYTASLDEYIPGEDIAMVCAPGVQCAAKDRWYARCHGTALAPFLVANAHTEPLARRAAALLAMAEQKEREG